MRKKPIKAKNKQKYSIKKEKKKKEKTKERNEIGSLLYFNLKQVSIYKVTRECLRSLIIII